MTPGLQLFFTLTAMNVVVSVLVTQLVARLAGGPRHLLAHIVPILASLACSGTLGHQLGVHLGPKINLYGFEVSIVWDVLVATIGAVVGAIAQAIVWRAYRRRSATA
jgi:hypothetical protein